MKDCLKVSFSSVPLKVWLSDDFRIDTALRPDNKTLFFVSDREGGHGMTDIYKVAINDDGTYGEPENLGAEINTEGKEVFPCVDSENMLYFSSEGFTNLGLLDIFKSNIVNYLDVSIRGIKIISIDQITSSFIDTLHYQILYIRITKNRITIVTSFFFNKIKLSLNVKDNIY